MRSLFQPRVPDTSGELEMTEQIRILFVDDEPGLRDIGKMYLEEFAGFSVTTAENGADAIHLLTEQTFDGIVSDYEMGEMSGIDLLKHIREKGDTTPFIIFTGKGREEVVIEALNNGVDFYLQKGGEPAAMFAELLNKINYAVSRRCAENKLESMVQNLKLSQQVAHIGNWTLDLKNNAFDASEEALQLFGFSAGQHPSFQDIVDKIHPGDRPLVHEAITRLTETEEPYTIDFRIYVNNTGEMRFIHSKGQLLQSEWGYPVSIFGIYLDITDRKRAEAELLATNKELIASYTKITAGEEELRANLDELMRQEQAIRESEEKFKTLFESAGDAIFIMDDTVFLDCNRQTEKIFRCTRNQIIGHSPAIFSPERQPDGQISVKKAKEKIDAAFLGEPQTFDWVHTHYNGTPFNAEVSLNRVKVQGTYYLQAVVRDITERKQAEEALHLFKDLVEHSSDAIGMSTPEGRHYYQNEAFYRMFGNIGEYPPDTLYVDKEIGKHVFDTIIGGGSWHGEVKMFKHDGTILDILLRAYAIKNHEGHIIGLIGLHTDITDRKRIEEALASANKKLNLLSSITRHDINNQLTILMGYLEVLEDSDLESSSDEYCRKITTVVERISSMIRFTKEYDQIGIHSPVWQDTRTLVETAEREAPLREIMVKNDLPGGTDIFADLLIGKVFYNLIDNAVRYGGKISTIRFSAQIWEGDHIVVCEDDGDGVTADEKEKIFERGFGKNTGLGLFLSREILAITGLSIRECGVPGTGARFEILVPSGKFRIHQGDEQ